MLDWPRMLKLWFAPRTRAIRIAWLLEELGLPYELERGELAPPGTRPARTCRPRSRTAG